MPETDRIPTIQTVDGCFPRDAQLAFDVLQASLQSKTTSDKAQVEVRFVEVHARKGRLEIGNVEDAAKKRDQQIGVFERGLEMVFGQIFSPDEALHASVPVQSYDGHQSFAGRMAGRFDVEIQRAMAKRIEQPPMISALEARPEKIGSAACQPRLGVGEHVIIPAFFHRGDVGNRGTAEEC